MNQANRRRLSLALRGALLLLMPLIALLLASPARPAAADNGVIYFASERTGDWEIFAMNPDGSGQTNLTNSSTKDERPGASPDGTKIAFGRTVGSNTDIWVMNANGSGLKRLTTAPENDHAPQWSPDGAQIAFRSDRHGNAEIFVMNADGSNQTRLTNNPATDHGPDWSPDGQQILFSSDRDGNDNVFIMNADGSNVSPLTNNPADDFGGSWSPKGAKIVFRSDRNGEPEVYVMNSDGSGQTNLTNNPASDRGPAWSPDGSKVIFYSNRDDGDYEIYVMNPDGSNQTRLTRVAGRDFQPDWASDGGVVEPSCYALTRAHSGSGADPTASPNKSPDCTAGQYVAGAAITLTAAPAAGWHVAGWGGTANNSSTATTNSLTMLAADHTVSVTYTEDVDPILCYTLTRSHSGSGANPTASPAKSPDCTAGQYVAGASIALTAAPDAGWHMTGWSGTNNDSSTATTNTVTMPAADHTVSAIYEELPVTCFSLSRTHSGNGNNPVASPAFSTGCVTGQYTAGQPINLTATPAAGWHVAGWNNTNNDAGTSTTNTVTMPAAAHTVSVTYAETPVTCFSLTRTHSGNGDNPTAAPAASAGCATGHYKAGEEITLTADPAPDYHVVGWDGTDNDSSTATTNMVTMPAATHTVSVTYAEIPVTCFSLTRTHSGNGDNPTAAPTASSGCDTGEYKAGELITLTADPAAGWVVSGWSGTNNDVGTPTTNSVTMPPADHMVSVLYQAVVEECFYELALSHSGQGADPVAEPAQSPGCDAGRYVAGQAITLTAAPAARWGVTGWDGTNDDAATTLTNSLIMPAADHQVTVRYEPEPAQEEQLFLPVVLRPAGG